MKAKIFTIHNLKWSAILILSMLIISSCDIVDAITNIFNGEDDTDLSSQQEQALTTVLTLQDDASDIMDNLFSSGLDTLSVIDSLANFFLADTSIQNVWPDSEGVAVDYNSGISGGIFIRRFIPVEVTGSDSGDLDPFLDDDELGKKQYKQNTVVPIIKKSIIFDGSYSQFKNSIDPIVEEANSGFSTIGIDQFIKKFDNAATIKVLSTLDQYGIVHLSGHGWYKRKSNGFVEDKVTYLLTGEKAEINKTYGELWGDILEKNVIIGNYAYKKENRYWVSPKFVSDRNDFHNKNVFIYSGVCFGARRWMKEMVTNAGAKCMVAYLYSVKSNWEDFWARKMYRRMCDINYTEPYEIGECIKEIINEPYGVHYYQSSKPVHMGTYNREGRDLTFWENELLNGNVEFFLDQVVTNRSSSKGIEEKFSLWGSSGIFSNNVFTGNYNNQILGRTYSGFVNITFIDNPESINFHLIGQYTYQSLFGFGTVTFRYTVDYDGIPYTGLEGANHVYSATGRAVQSGYFTWSETNSQWIEELISVDCGDDAYIRVEVDRRE
ncbi:MAG: hypothetical protein GWP19_03180 [Planctomycetia bacterium]|nr:hypothetical protein [Planctomycetia bacterium]